MTMTKAFANWGSLMYLSPEQVQQKHTRKLDIWALGCVLLQCATGQKPWHSSSVDFQDNQGCIVSCARDDGRKMRDGISSGRWPCGKSSGKGAPETVVFRNPLEFAEAHNTKEELNTVKDRNFHRILKRMLAHDHKERPTAEELCNDKFFKVHVTQLKKSIPVASGWCQE